MQIEILKERATQSSSYDDLSGIALQLWLYICENSKIQSGVEDIELNTEIVECVVDRSDDAIKELEEKEYIKVNGKNLN